MARFFATVFSTAVVATALVALAQPARAEMCQNPDNLTFVSGNGHCLAIKTYPPANGPAKVLAVVLHGDLSSGGVADEVFFMAEEAAKAGAVGVAMMRPGYTGDGRRSTGIATRDQDRDDRYRAADMDSITVAVRSLKANHGVDRVVMIGFSGGAVISGVMLGRAAPLVSGAVLLSCPCNVPEWREYNNWGPLYNAESPHAYIGRIPKGTPVIALTGENDGNTHKRFAIAYVEKANAAGAKARFVEVPGANHGLRRIKEQPQLTDAIREVIQGN